MYLIYLHNFSLILRGFGNLERKIYCSVYRKIKFEFNTVGEHILFYSLTTFNDAGAKVDTVDTF